MLWIDYRGKNVSKASVGQHCRNARDDDGLDQSGSCGEAGSDQLWLYVLKGKTNQDPSVVWNPSFPAVEAKPSKTSPKTCVTHTFFMLWLYSGNQYAQASGTMMLWGKMRSPFIPE